MHGADATSRVAMKIFGKEQIITEVAIMLQLGLLTKEWPVPLVIAKEELAKPLGQFIRYTVDGEVSARSGGAFDLEVIAIVVVETLQ